MNARAVTTAKRAGLVVRFSSVLLSGFANLAAVVGGQALLTLVVSCTAQAAPNSPLTTTVYVGGHFELRDHDQPTKYIFNGDTRVAAVTGSLSANQRVQRLRLYAGWNLCSMAVTGPFAGPGTEALLAVFQWDGASGNYSPVAFGQTLSAGTVLWVRAASNAVVSLAGSYVEPVAGQSQAGGAYVPGAGLEAWLPALPDGGSAWEFDAATAQWSDSLAGDLAGFSSPLTELSPGQAFFLEAPAVVSLQPPNPALRIRYYHEDHLGSSSVITDGAGTLVEETAFLPFGLARNQIESRQVREPYEFTQKERDRETSLHYFETRYLASALGRFITPDRKDARLGDRSRTDFSAAQVVPQQLNPYAYVQNDPVRYVDPLGEDPKKPGNPPVPQNEVTLTLNVGGRELNIPVTSVELGTRQGAVSSDKAAAAAKEGFREFHITKSRDESTPILMREASGAGPQGLMSGELTFRRTVNGRPEVFMKFKLTSTVIAHVQLNGSAIDNNATESVTLNGKMEIEFPQPGQTSELNPQAEHQPAQLGTAHDKDTPHP